MDWIGNEMKRMLTTDPATLKALVRKTSFILASENESDLAAQFMDQQTRLNPATTVSFSTEFVKYFLEREKKLPECCKEIGELRQKQTALLGAEREARNALENVRLLNLVITYNLNAKITFKAFSLRHYSIITLIKV